MKEKKAAFPGWVTSIVIYIYSCGGVKVRKKGSDNALSFINSTLKSANFPVRRVDLFIEVVAVVEKIMTHTLLIEID